MDCDKKEMEKKKYNRLAVDFLWWPCSLAFAGDKRRVFWVVAYLVWSEVIGELEHQQQKGLSASSNSFLFPLPSTIFLYEGSHVPRPVWRLYRRPPLIEPLYISIFVSLSLLISLFYLEHEQKPIYSLSQDWNFWPWTTYLPLLTVMQNVNIGLSMELKEVMTSYEHLIVKPKYIYLQKASVSRPLVDASVVVDTW